MSLKEKIKQYGFEIEYPMEGCIGPDDYDDDDDEYDDSGDHDGINAVLHEGNVVNDYNTHHDGDGIEFSTPKPLPLDAMLAEVRHIYKMCETLCEHPDYSQCPDFFDTNDTGIHIRLDVTNWSKREILRFSRLFSGEFENDRKYEDFIDWMADNFRRSWSNFNEPIDYDEFRAKVNENSYRRETRKFGNIHYENQKFKDAVTLEVRCFAVPERVEDALAMFDFIHLLCDITDKSFEDDTDDKAIIDKLYDAWCALA